MERPVSSDPARQNEDSRVRLIRELRFLDFYDGHRAEIRCIADTGLIVGCRGSGRDIPPDPELLDDLREGVIRILFEKIRAAVPALPAAYTRITLDCYFHGPHSAKRSDNLLHHTFLTLWAGFRKTGSAQFPGGRNRHPHPLPAGQNSGGEAAVYSPGIWPL